MPLVRTHYRFKLVIPHAPDILCHLEFCFPIECDNSKLQVVLSEHRSPIY